MYLNKKKYFIFLSRIYTFLIVAYPILGLYKSIIIDITFADFLLLLLFPFLLFSLYFYKRKTLFHDIISVNLLILFIYVLLHVLVQMFFYFNNNLILSTLRYMFYLFNISFLIKTFFDIKFATKILKVTTVISSIFLIIQYILYKFLNIYIYGSLIQFQINGSQIREYIGLYNKGNYIRMSSFFSEPSHFAIYSVLFLLINLNQKKLYFKDYIISFIVSLAILLSESSTGIILLFFIWIMFFLNKIFRSKSNKLLIFGLSSIPFIAFINSNSFNIFLNRTFSDNGLGNAAMRRFESFSLYYNIFGRNTWEILFGKGMINLNKYLPGIVRITYFYGIIGSLIFLLVFTNLYIKKNKLKRKIIFVFLILNIGTEIIFGNFLLLYLAFVVTNKKFCNNI